MNICRKLSLPTINAILDQGRYLSLCKPCLLHMWNVAEDRPLEEHAFRARRFDVVFSGPSDEMLAEAAEASAFGNPAEGDMRLDTL